MSPHQISGEERIAAQEDRSARFWRVWNPFINKAKKFKENKKLRFQARVRHHQQKEAHTVFAAHSADTCLRISALWAKLIYSWGAPGYRA